VKGADVGVALEVVDIEGKDTLDRVKVHDGYEPGIIDQR
jgi:hypothetical protein